MAEYLPLCDDKGNITGKELRSVCHNGQSMLLHPVVHLHIFNKKGELYLQLRSMQKDIQPGMWDTSVGGHVDPGEGVEEAMLREASEEASFMDFDYKLVKKYIWQSKVERELVHCYITTSNQLPVPHPDEVDEGRFWTKEEINAKLGKGVFTPNFEKEFSDILMEYFA